MFKIGVTGPLASGKSSACRFLSEIGAYVIDADCIVHNLLDPQTKLGKRVVSLLGQETVQNGQFVRERIADLVFKDPQKLQALEQILHPAVRREIDRAYLRLRDDPTKELFIAEVPLLFEAGFGDAFDKVIVVDAPREDCLKRFTAKTCYDALEYDRRMMRRWSPLEMRKQADYILENRGNLDTLKLQVHHLVDRIKKEIGLCN